MAKGTNGLTLVSKTRLELFKALYDLQLSTNYLGISSTASAASQLASTVKINGISFNGASDVSNYGVCDTQGSTAEKAVTITGFNFTNGAKITIKFTNANTASNPTLNVNSQVSGTAIYYNGSVAAANMIEAGGIYDFTYDGTNFLMSGSKSYTPFTAATANDDGSDGLVPGPTSGNNTGKYLDASGSWSIPAGTTYTNFVAATSLSAGTAGLVPAPAVGDDATKFLNSTGGWSVPYSVFTGATSSADGTTGLVPAPTSTNSTKVLTNHGTWVNLAQATGGVDRYYHEESASYEVGEIVHIAEWPNNYALEATTAGTTGSTAPNFESMLTSE